MKILIDYEKLKVRHVVPKHARAKKHKSKKHYDRKKMKRGYYD